MRSRLLIIMACIGGQLWSQTQAPTFEVATVKPFSPEMLGGRGRGGGGSSIKGDRLDLPIITLAALLPYAFRVKEYQVSAPAWTHQSRWSISAKIPNGVSADQTPEMVRALLAERFKLAMHREKRERTVYTLSVAESGTKLQPASPDDFPSWDGSFPGFNFRGPLPNSGPITGRVAPGSGCSKRWEFVPLPMSALADALSLFLNRPVVDQTRMEGKYRVVLEMSPETEAGIMTNVMAGRGAAPPGAGGEGGGRRGPAGGGDGPRPPSNLSPPGCAEPITLLSDGVGAPDGAITKALQQLGLKLTQAKAPIDTIVVDHLETKPTEN